MNKTEVEAVDVEERVLLRVVKREGDNVKLSLNCKPLELFGLIGGLVTTLSNESNGVLSYNQILDDLKEIEGEN